MTKASDNAFPSVLITEGTEPSAPAAGKQRLYIDSTTHHLKRTDSSGTDVDIETAAGGAATSLGFVTYQSEASLSAERVVTAPSSGGVIAAMVYKSADEVVNNSSSLQDDNHLLYALASTGAYAFELNMWFDSAAAQDIKFGFTVPASTTLYWSETGNDSAGAATTDSQTTTSSGGTRTGDGQGVGTIRHKRIKGYVETTGTSGNLQFQWAQNTATTSDTTVHKGSWLTVWKLA